MVYKSYISYICIYMRTWAWCSRTLAVIYLFCILLFEDLGVVLKKQRLHLLLGSV